MNRPVDALVKAKYPGVRLESDVQGWTFLEEFERGIEAYHALESPTPQDDRWLGVCYYQLFRDLDALEALNRAVARGQESARINLAHLSRFIERSDEADTELRSIDVDALNDYDKVFYQRVLSLHEESTGNLRDALSAAEEAWTRVQRIPEFRLLAPAILAQLAVLHGRIGRSQRSLWFLEQGLQLTGGIENLKVRLKRVSVLINLGRYQEALSELESIDLGQAPEAFGVEYQWLHGDLAWSTGSADRARHDFLEAAGKAMRLQLGYEELLCRLALVRTYSASRDFIAAREQITRAQALISDRSDRLVFRFREILLLYWERDYSPQHAIDELQALVEDFGAMGLMQEQCAVRLHKADILRSQGSEAYVRELDQVQAMSIALQNQSFLAREWPLLPELQRVAQVTHERIAGRLTPVIKVFTLGQERLVLAGQTISIPLRRGVEVLAYFLEHKAVTLADLLTDVFPSDKPRSAKSYFHQFRHQLREAVDGLEIEFDGESKMYRLKSEIDILWDVAELRAGRVMAETGTFLPTSGNPWALDLDRELEGQRDTAGVFASA